MFNHPSYSSGEQIVNFRRFIVQNLQNIDLITSRLLLEVGFKMHLCGANYLREAIKYCYNAPQNARLSFNGKVYPYIAKQVDSTARNVDRDIRTVIQRCYESGRMFLLNDLCGYEMISPQYPPTNTEFVIDIVCWLKTYEASKAS